MDGNFHGEARNVLTPEERRIRRKKLARKRKFRLAIVAIGFFLVLAVITSPIVIFATFRIKGFGVEGESGYSKEQIIEASGLKAGDGLIFADLEKAAANVEKRLPYADKVKLTKKLPNKIIIRLGRTSRATAVETARGDYALTNASLKTLEFSPTVPDGLTVIVGATPVNPSEGSVLTFSSDKTSEIIKELVGEITENKIEGVDLINVALRDGIYLIYQGRVVWRLGNSSNLASKLSLGKRAMERENEMFPGQRGILNLTVEKKAYFNRADFQDVKELVDYEERRAPGGEER